MGVCDTAEIRVLCQAHCDWIDTELPRGVQSSPFRQRVQQLPGSQDVLPMYCAQELQLSQQQDSGISKVLRLFKQWEKLEVHGGVLYRVMKDPVSKQRRFQYVLPQSL